VAGNSISAKRCIRVCGIHHLETRQQFLGASRAPCMWSTAFSLAGVHSTSWFPRNFGAPVQALVDCPCFFPHLVSVFVRLRARTSCTGLCGSKDSAVTMYGLQSTNQHGLLDDASFRDFSRYSSNPGIPGEDPNREDISILRLLIPHLKSR
jgi:hypothetical protein